MADKGMTKSGTCGPAVGYETDERLEPAEVTESAEIEFKPSPGEIEKMDLLERPYLERFRDFYHDLPPGPHWFMFFTSGLLNIVDRSLRFLPSTVSPVLICSSLPAAELDWLRHARPDLPIHHIPLLIDDKTVWEFLFAVATEDFGWIDIDCFIQDLTLLDEMQEPGKRVALAGPFCFSPRPILRTHLLWVTAGAVADLQRQVPTSPATYAYRLTHAQRFPKHSFCRVLNEDQIRHIRKIINLDDDNQPLVGQGGILDLYSNGITLHSSERGQVAQIFSPNTRRLFPLYDTLVVVQLILSSLGYRCRVHRGGIPDISPPAVHWKSISYHRRIGQDIGDLTVTERRHMPAHHRFTLLADALLMFELLETQNPPAGYDGYARLLADRLAQEGYTLHAAGKELTQHLEKAGVDAKMLRTDERWKFLHNGT